MPATFASLVSLFAIAPAETMVNRLLHAPHPMAATTQGEETTSEIVLRTHHGPHENPAMRLQRYAYKPHQPQDDGTSSACVEPCFDPNDFEPASGGVAGSEHGSQPSGFGHGGGGGGGHSHLRGFDPPSSPSHEAQFDTAGIAEFARGGPGGGSSTGAGGHGAGRNGGEGGNGGDETSFVLLPGSGTPSGENVPTGGNGGGGGGGGGNIFGEGGDGNEAPPQGGGGRGISGNGGSGGSPPLGGVGGNGNDGGGNPGNDGGGNPGNDDGEDGSEVETINLRVAPAAGPTEVSAPATASLFAAAFALLAWRRRAL